MINFWVDQPKLNSDRQIYFSGIAPGGYRGQDGLIISLVFLTRNPGQEVIEVSSGQTLLNDGLGTAADFKTVPFNFSIAEKNPALPEPPSLIFIH